MSKRKASYDLTFKLKAVKCAEEKTKEEAAAREFNVDPRRNSETVMEIAWFFSLLKALRRFLVSICICIRGGLLQHSPSKSTIARDRKNSNNSPA